MTAAADCAAWQLQIIAYDRRKGIHRRIIGQIAAAAGSFSHIDPDSDTVLMVEAGEEAIHVRHHKQKIVLVVAMISGPVRGW